METKLEIDIKELTERPITVDVNIPSGDLGLEDEEFEFGAPVKGSITFSLVKDKVIAKGSIKTKAKAICARCLKEFEFECQAKFNTYYVKEPKVSQALEEVEPDGSDISYYDGEVIKPADDIRELLMSKLPDFPHCSPQCKGLCPQCGTDLNIRTCSCNKVKQTTENDEKKDWKNTIKRIKLD